MNAMILILILQPFTAQAGLECRKNEIHKAILAITTARDSNCTNAEHLRLASQSLRELATEPACDRGTIDLAQRALAEARVAPLLNEPGQSCKELLAPAQARLEQLTKSVKTEPSRRGSGH